MPVMQRKHTKKCLHHSGQREVKMHVDNIEVSFPLC